MAADDLTTTAELKTALRIADTDDDTRIDAGIEYCTAWIKRYLGRAVLYNPSATATTEYHDGDGEGLFFSKEWPVVSTTSLHVSADRAYDSGDLLTEDTHFLVYSSDDEGRYERILESNIANVITGEQPVFPVGQKNIKLVYVPGYTTASRANLPLDLQMACQLLVQSWMNQGPGAGLVSVGRGGTSENYEMGWKIPVQARRLLARFRSFHDGL